MKVNIVLGNFSLSSVYADLGYFWVLTIQSLKDTGLVEADKSTALYN